MLFEYVDKIYNTGGWGRKLRLSLEKLLARCGRPQEPGAE